ncbi:MAG: guanine deaminase [Herbinix sp.]|jgi:guanine deaminase|nr:guanine deaminase [Herbinix sp.]
MDMKLFALKGNILYSRSPKELVCIPHGYLICEDGKVEGVYEELPEKFNGINCTDYQDSLIIPGLIDLHTHAPQYAIRSLGMDMELLKWLEHNTFPEEAKYADIEYARKAYSIFVDDMKKSATTRACIFGTIHVEGTGLLMDLLEETGLKCKVGKVNMNRNCPPVLCEDSEQSLHDTKQWLDASRNKYQNVTPIITPRFLPSCTEDLLTELSVICREENLPVQSHLSENLLEIEFVKELFPNTAGYADAYNEYGLFGGPVPTIMAHCIYLTKEEIELVYDNKVFIAHCPDSNMNLSSGIAPVRTYLDRGLKMGLGSDVAAGDSLSIFKMMTETVKVSKLLWRLQDQSLTPLSMEEAFYLGTKGGGEFFGKVGSFEPGYEFDAVVIDDSSLVHPQPLTLKQRLERVIYLSDDRHMADKYVAGTRIK